MARLTLFAIVVLGLAGLSAFGQAASSLTEDFKQDSLGCKGLRSKHVAVLGNKTQKGNESEVFFDGKSIIGKTKQEIIDLLGPPNYKSDNRIRKRRKKNFDTLNYCCNCGNTRPGISITINLTNDIVTSTGFIVHD